MSSANTITNISSSDFGGSGDPRDTASIFAGEPIEDRQPTKKQSVSNGYLGDEAAIFLLVDFSQGMKLKVNGERKITVFQKNIGKLLNDLPKNSEVGLRVFGNRFGTRDKKKSCQDSTLITGTISDHQQVLAQIGKVQAKGYSTLAYAVKNTVEDVKYVDRDLVILLMVTAQDNCSGDPILAVKSLLSSRPQTQVWAVNFLGNAKTQEELMAVVAASDGKLFTIADPTEVEEVFGEIGTKLKEHFADLAEQKTAAANTETKPKTEPEPEPKPEVITDSSLIPSSLNGENASMMILKDKTTAGVVATKPINNDVSLLVWLGIGALFLCMVIGALLWLKKKRQNKQKQQIQPSVDLEPPLNPAEPESKAQPLDQANLLLSDQEGQEDKNSQ